MNETSKASIRRNQEIVDRKFDWATVLSGQGIDVGSGEDPLTIAKCTPFDKEQGDANELSKYFARDSVDFIHASQSLEHMIDPVFALRNWLLCVKTGGHIVCTIPDFVLYEQLNWPSRYNGDHKSTWSLWLPDSPAPIHCLLPYWLQQFPVEILRCKLIDTNYDYKMIGKKDQTFEDKGVEAFIEFVVQKL